MYKAVKIINYIKYKKVSDNKAQDEFQYCMTNWQWSQALPKYNVSQRRITEFVAITWANTIRVS